jgi:hypothetical protein
VQAPEVNETGIEFGNLTGDPLRSGTWDPARAPTGIYNEWLDIDAAWGAVAGLDSTLGSKSLSYGNAAGMTVKTLLSNGHPNESLDVNGLNASWAMVLLGTHDMDGYNEDWALQATQDEFRADYLFFVQELQLEGTIPVLFTIPPFNDITDNGALSQFMTEEAAVQAVNDIIISIAGVENLIWVDLHDLVQFYQTQNGNANNAGLMHSNGIRLRPGDLSLSESNVTQTGGTDLLTLLVLETAMLMKEHVGDPLNPDPNIIVTPPATPATPALTSITPHATLASIDITWDAVADPKTGYKIYNSTTISDPTPDLVEQINDPLATSYTSGGLLPGTTYYYKIKSINSTSESAFSNELTADTQGGTVPNVPTIITPADVLGENSITVSWIDNSTDETQFEINMGTSSGNLTQAGWVGSQPNSGDTVSFTWNGLASGTTYYFAVKARNGEGDSALSGEVSATTDSGIAGPDGDPTSLQATAFNNSIIDLTWSESITNEEGFQVWQSPEPGGVFTLLDPTTAANATTYQITGLADGTSYTFKVRAFNDGGANLSNYSNEATVSTSSLPGSPILQVARDKGITRSDRTLVHVSEFAAKRYTVDWQDGSEWIIPPYAAPNGSTGNIPYKTTYSTIKTLPTLTAAHIDPPDGLLVVNVTDEGTLRAAIENGASNKIVYLADGTYQAGATPFDIDGSSNLFIVGLNSDPESVTIRGAGVSPVSPSRTSAVFTVTNSRNIGFEYLTITESHAHGIRLDGNNNIYDVDILGCKFTNIYEAAIKGTANSTGSTIVGTNQNILIADNTFDNSGVTILDTWYANGDHTAAIDIEVGQNVIIQDNTFTGYNGGSLGGGFGAILVHNESDDITVIRNVITDSDAGISFGIASGHTEAYTGTDYHVANGVIARNAVNIHSTSGAVNLSDVHYVDVEHNTLYQLSNLNPAVKLPNDGATTSNQIIFNGNITRGTIDDQADNNVLDVTAYNHACVDLTWLDANLKLTAAAEGSALINNENIIFNMENGYSANKLWTDYWPDYGAYDYGL